MALPLLKLLPSILKTAAGALGVNIESAARVIVGEQLTPAQQAALQSAMQAHEAEMERLSIEAMKVAMSESLVMIASEDKFVKRARPTMLYVATGITTVLCIIIGIAILKGVKVDLGAVGAITSLMIPLWGVSGTYVYRRTTEKLNGGEK